MGDESNAVVVGIDLGTVNSCVATYENGEAKVLETRDGLTIPSVVYFDPVQSDPIVGAFAQIPTTTMENKIYDAKRFIGRKFNEPDIQSYIPKVSFKAVSDNNQIFFEIKKNKETRRLSPENVSTALLSYLKQVLLSENDVDEVKAIITVPAYFTTQQKLATKKAAHDSGIEVLQLISEPTAAGLYFHHTKKAFDCRVLVFDLGGGTFDISILKISKNSIRVECVDGDSFLGGRDFDARITDFICKTYLKNDMSEIEKTRIMLSAEKIKIFLSKKTEVTHRIELLDGQDFVDITITRDEFEKICEDLFEKCMDVVKRCLKETKLDKRDINNILLVGGSTRIPTIKKRIQDFFPNTSIEDDFNPDQVVAQGAAILAQMKNPIIRRQVSKPSHSDYDIMPAEQFRKMFLTESVPFNIGFEEYFGYVSVVFPKGTQTPTNKMETITTNRDNQRTIDLRIYEGKWKNAKANNLLGTLSITNIPPQKAGYEIEVNFEIDVNNILRVQSDNSKELMINLDTDDTVEESKINVWTPKDDDTFERIVLLKKSCANLCKNYMSKHRYNTEEFNYFMEILDSRFEDSIDFSAVVVNFKKALGNIRHKGFLKILDDIIHHCGTEDVGKLRTLVDYTISVTKFN